MKVVGITQSVFLSCKQSADKMLVEVFLSPLWRWNVKLFTQSFQKRSMLKYFLFRIQRQQQHQLRKQLCFYMSLYKTRLHALIILYNMLLLPPQLTIDFFMIFRIWFMISLHDEKCYDYESLWWTMYYKIKLKLRAFFFFSLLFSFLYSPFYVPI